MICQATILALATLSPGESELPKRVELANKHLAVTFENRGDGLRLTIIEDRARRQVYRLEASEEIAMLVLPPSSIHDPEVAMRYAFQDDFTLRGVDVSSNRAGMVLRFLHPMLDVEVAYQLHPEVAELRKTTTCTARAGGAYVAGITHWMFKLEGLARSWPRDGALGQPAIFLGPEGGCFVTLEWPRTRVASVEGDLRVAYRPGYNVAPGQTQEVAAGAIGFFSSYERPDAGPCKRSAEGRMDDARQAFFRHVTRRVQPQVPFPVKFTTWGPWLGQARADRILEILDDLEYVGADLFHFDAGWQHPDYPYSKRMPQVRGADDRSWDRRMTQPERLPDGLLTIAREAKRRGMKLSLWFDACGNVFVREGEKWAVRDSDGQPVVSRMWEGRWPEAPRQSLASPYGDRLEEFVLQMLDRYDLGGVMFDNHHYTPDHSTRHDCLANGFDSEDVQLRRILEILDEVERRRPGIYRFYCRNVSWPWALRHATHIHAGDPGMSSSMRRASETDHPARAMAFERRFAWQRHYDHFVPPWGVKGDIAGWSVQQKSPIPVNLEHTGLLIPTGEGWTQNMFTCFATTAVRDVRFSFEQMPSFDREILRKWLAWDRRRSKYIFHCQPVLKGGDDPNRGLDGYSHVGGGRGVVYLFNRSFEPTVAELVLDERAGFRWQDRKLAAYLVYPVKCPVGDGALSYGQTLRLPLIGKDCAVVEVGLEPPDDPRPYDEYVELVGKVRRSYETLFLAAPDRVFEAAGRGPVRVEVGSSARDRRLAAQVLETIGTATGQRLAVERCAAVATEDAACRLIVGSIEGLAEHRELGDRFRRMLDNVYVAWQGKLYSAPLVAELDGAGPPTYCLIAPRPEQLARLSIDLTSRFLEGAKTLVEPEAPEPVWRAHSFELDVPHGRPALRFHPVVRQFGHVPLPGDLAMLRFQIEVEREGERSVIWAEAIPPFAAPGHGSVPTSFGGMQWWRDRVISIADLAGKRVRFHLSASPTDGRQHPQLEVGYDRFSLVGPEAQRAAGKAEEAP
jgi:hypothetical protein